MKNYKFDQISTFFAILMLRKLLWSLKKDISTSVSHMASVQCLDTTQFKSMGGNVIYPNHANHALVVVGVM